jgi:fatty acid desaturase
MDAQLKAAAKTLGTLSPWRSGGELASTWLQIVAALLVCLAYPGWLVWIVGFLFIGARQYALLILLHDGSHSLLHPSRRINDWISLWLIAAPCGSSYVNSRSSHLSHHRNLGSAVEDPDYFLYCSGSPAPKRTASALALHFVKLVAGGQVMHTLFSESRAGRAQGPGLAKTVATLLPVLAVQLTLLGLFWWSGHVYAYFVLWLAPLVTLAVLFNGLRVFCDHATTAEAGESEDLLVTYVSNPLERFFVAPFDMNYHAEHHYFPFVPHYNLPKLRKLLLESAEGEKLRRRESYTGFILQYLRRGRAPGESAAPSRSL